MLLILSAAVILKLVLQNHLYRVSVQVENVECIPPKTIKLDFLGKDSIQYENRVEVEEEVFRNIQQFCKSDYYNLSFLSVGLCFR